MLYLQISSIQSFLLQSPLLQDPPSEVIGSRVPSRVTTPSGPGGALFVFLWTRCGFENGSYLKLVLDSTRAAVRRFVLAPNAIVLPPKMLFPILNAT